jgi:hypothetical protein
VTRGKDRTRPCSSADARQRLRQAHAYLETAELVDSEGDGAADSDFTHVAAGVAVLAAIAAADALCCHALGERARGQDHRSAADLLRGIRLGSGNHRSQEQHSRRLADALLTALDLKDESHYGTHASTGTGTTRRPSRA